MTQAEALVRLYQDSPHTTLGELRDAANLFGGWPCPGAHGMTSIRMKDQSILQIDWMKKEATAVNPT